IPKPGLDRQEGQGYALGTDKDPTSTERRKFLLYAVDFSSGRIRWTAQLRDAVPLEAKQLKNTYASETPVTDGRRVYVYLGGIHALVAVDMNGKVVWSTAVKQPEVTIDAAAPRSTTFSGDLMNMGSAASPVLHNGRI